MSDFSIIRPEPPELSSKQAMLLDPSSYHKGQAIGVMAKTAASPENTVSMKGRLIFSKSGWGLLTVPNSFVRGVFDTLTEPGIQLPVSGMNKRLRAHISVFSREDMDQIGGYDKVSEWGNMYNYQIGPLQTVVPRGWGEMSRVWFVKVHSPELKQLRKTYGLSPLPRGGKHDFHITVAVRPRKVLQNNRISKAARDDAAVQDYIMQLTEQIREDLSGHFD